MWAMVYITGSSQSHPHQKLMRTTSKPKGFSRPERPNTTPSPTPAPNEDHIRLKLSKGSSDLSGVGGVWVGVVFGYDV